MLQNKRLAPHSFRPNKQYLLLLVQNFSHYFLTLTRVPVVLLAVLAADLAGDLAVLLLVVGLHGRMVSQLNSKISPQTKHFLHSSGPAWLEWVLN